MLKRKDKMPRLKKTRMFRGKRYTYMGMFMKTSKADQQDRFVRARGKNASVAKFSRR